MRLLPIPWETPSGKQEVEEPTAVTPAHLPVALELWGADHQAQGICWDQEHATVL